MALLLIVVVFVFVLVAVSWHFSNLVIYPDNISREELLISELEAGRIDKTRYETWMRQEVEIHSPYGYVLKGLYFPFEGSRRTVIICHGITANLITSVKYMDLYRDRGFNILIYDHRNHGFSGGNNTTFGFYEKFDLKAWVDWVVDICGSDCTIGTHGESLGAGTVLQHLAIDNRVAFTVADCGFSDLARLLAFRLKADYHLPEFPLLPVTNLIIRMRTGMHFKAVSPIRDLERVDVPILFAHGELDTYVPTSMSIEMYEQKPSSRRLYIAPNAGHVASYMKNRSEYDREVGSFLAQAISEHQVIR